MSQNDNTPIVGRCPICGSNSQDLIFEPGQTRGMCGWCGGWITKERMLSSIASAAPAAAPASAPAQTAQAAAVNVINYAQYVETPSAGLAYLENKIETLKTDEFEVSGDFTIPGIGEMVEKNKVTNADKPETWELVFKSNAFPLNCKLKGVEKLEKQIADIYLGSDLTPAFDLFDNYNYLVRRLKNQNVCVKEIKAAAKFYKKYGGEQEKLDRMNAEIAELEGKIAALPNARKLEELPLVKKASENKTAEIAKKLAEQGIDAEKEYQEAIRICNDKSMYPSGLALFERLGAYKDSKIYAAKINATHNIFDGLMEMNGKLYFVESKSAEAFDVTQVVKDSEKRGCSGGSGKGVEPLRKVTFELHRILQGIEEEAPIVKGITRFLFNYDGKIFYIASDEKLMFFDTKNEQARELDTGKRGDYLGVIPDGKDLKPLMIQEGTQFIMRKKIHREVSDKKGCFGKKKVTPVVNKNKYKLLLVDMKSATVKQLDEIEDLNYAFDGAVFFTQSRVLQHTEFTNKKHTKQRTVSEVKSFFCCMNTKTFELTDVFDGTVEVCAVVDGKVVYMHRSPSNLNEDLCVFNLDTKEHKLIERNVYDFFKIIDGKIYYVVGAYFNRILFAVNFDGTGRKEIAKNIGEIAFERNGWMYAVKGSGKNRAFVKISNDGSKTILIAFGFKELVKYSAGYIYYISRDNELCVVRSDGAFKRTLTEGVNSRDDVVIENENLYVLKNEAVGYDNKESVYSYTSSLYLLDSDGNGTRKLMYGIDKIYDPGYNDDRIFVKSSQEITYRVSVPDKKRIMIPHTETHLVQYYYVLDKASQEIKLLFKKGEPTASTTHFKKGCFKKAADINSVIEPITTSNSECFNKID